MRWGEIWQFVKKIFDWLKDALFPRRCLGCQAWGEWCCLKCLAELEFPRQLHCPSCGTASPVGEFCPSCKTGRALDGLWAVQPYGQPLIKKLIHDFKYEYLTELADTLGQILITTLRAYQLPPVWHSLKPSEWQLVPVPLARRRLRERGFNQADLLAQIVARATGLKKQDILTRAHTTMPQSKITDYNKRRQNLRQVFKLKPEVNCQNQVYILVDDVYTSGTTLEECAKLLKSGGALEVWGLTVAKG
ncbi:MAG: ComF family protein [Candidatus Kerfeldbacteria bacterium]|nr:ComF family protein [Candidatus Kerfeldbacteria bacterium]